MAVVVSVTAEVVSVNAAPSVEDPFSHTGNTVVKSFNSRVNHVVPASGDYTTTLVTNASTVTGATAGAALEWLAANRQPLDADLTAIAAITGTGFAARTADDTWALRSIAVPAAGLSITNPAGVAGNPTLALANDLAALEGLASTGIAVRTAADTWAQRSVAVSGNGISVANGDGVAANPTLSLETGLAAISQLAKTDGNIIVGNGTTWVAESGATARTSLGVAIGSDVQAWNDNLDDLAALAHVDGNIIVSDGTDWTVESGATARATLDAVGGRAALTENYYLRANASGDAVNSIVYDDGSTVYITGNLDVAGTTTTYDSTTVVIADPLIKLAKDNSGDVLDIGFYGQYNDGTTKFTGIFRDATDGKYRLFSGLQSEPTTTVNVAGTGYAVATLVANLESSNVTISGGSISGITDLAVADGGTGASTAADALTNLTAVGGRAATAQTQYAIPVASATAGNLVDSDWLINGATMSRAGAMTIQTTTATSLVLGTNSAAALTIQSGAEPVRVTSVGIEAKNIQLGTGSSASGSIGIGTLLGNGAWVSLTASGSDNYIRFGTLQSGVSAGERARFTPAGQFLVGTTSSLGSETLRVAGSSVLGDMTFGAADGTISRAGAMTIQTTGANALDLQTNSATRLFVSSTGTIGFTNSSPPGWSASTYAAIQLGGNNGIMFTRSVGAGASLFLTNNAYFDGASWKYITTDEASYYRQTGGIHSWLYAASGAAGTHVSFAEAMRINASGQVGIGTASFVGSETLRVNGQIICTAATPLIAHTSTQYGSMSLKNTSDVTLAYFWAVDAGVTEGAFSALKSGAERIRLRADGASFFNTGAGVVFGGDTAVGSERAYFLGGSAATPAVDGVTVGGGSVRSGADSYFNGVRVGLGGGGVSTNICVGNGAMAVTATGGENCIGGRSAGAAITSGTGNTTWGNGALQAVATTSGATAIGYISCLNLTTATNIVAVGASSARYQSGGTTALTANTNSLFLGTNTKGTQSATNEIVVGYAAEGAGSNTARWGNTSITAHYFSGVIRIDGTQVLGAQVASADQAAVTLGNADSEIGALTISAAYDQTEVQALRDKCEELADDVRALSTLVHSLRTAGVSHGLIKGAA